MSQDTRKDPRAKIVSLNVRYKSATVDEFIDNHSHDVSRGGLFIKTSTPFAQGTLLKFEIRLSSDQPVIAGVGRVVWKREPSQAAGERPAGMGVKFIKIDDRSRALIERLVTTKSDAGAAFATQSTDDEITKVHPSVPPRQVELPSVKTNFLRYARGPRELGRRRSGGGTGRYGCERRRLLPDEHELGSRHASAAGAHDDAPGGRAARRGAQGLGRLDGRGRGKSALRIDAQAEQRPAS
ncbi:MAG: TIGR02266 family protein [Polyangiaceae bacterium]